MTVAGASQSPQDPDPDPDPGPRDPFGSFGAFTPYRPSRALPADRGQPGPGPRPTGREELLSTLGYFGVIFSGPVVPLVLYVTRRRSSPFVRRNAAQALNVALTFLLYGVSGSIIGGLLALDNVRNALLVMVPIAVIGWAIMATQLLHAAASASRGGFRQLPGWICSPLVK
jgi:Domain of unknown function (DUF4870)